MEIKSKNITPVLVILYLLPWGIQCLVNTFMPIYVASLPYGDATCVSQVIAVGAVITVILQLIWSKWVDHSKNKSDILCLSLVLLGGSFTCVFKAGYFKNYAYGNCHFVL